MGKTTALRCAGASLPPALAVALLLTGALRDPRPTPPPNSSAHSPATASSSPLVDLGPVVTTHASCRHEPFAPEALTHARSRTARPEPTADERTLARSLTEADRPEATSRELQDLGSLLTRLLAQRPELAPAAARALAGLHQRPVLFQVGRALRAAADDPATRAELLALTLGNTAGSDAAREAGIAALGHRPDAEALAAFASVLADDPTAGPLTRAGAAYELAHDLDAAPEPVRQRAVASARGLVADASTDAALRVEAWGVLATGGLDDADRARARETVAADSSSLPLALAAAHALLDSGEPPTSVARALAPRGQSEPVLAALLARLERGGRLESR